MKKILPRKRWGHAIKHAWIALFGSKNIYIHHSVTASAGKNATIGEDAETVATLDSVAHNRGFSGISYNFACTQAGHSFAGRGWRWMGAHNDGENDTSYGIVAVGNFETTKPTDDLIAAIITVIKDGQKKGRIRKRPRIRGHKDSDSTACPGKRLYARLPEIRKAVNGRG